MNYISPEIGDQLAADYVLGTMPVRTRQRFDAMLKLSPQLRRAVAAWEARLTPMASTVPELAPPKRVWQAIQETIFGKHSVNRDQQSSWWSSLGFWRTVTGFAMITLVAFSLLVLAPAVDDSTIDPATDSMMVVVMEDTQTQTPAMTVSWESGGANHRLLRLRVIGHAEMAPGTAWELWMMPRGDGSPISLGLITTHELQTLRVPRALAQPLDDAWGLGMTVEPKGGSPSGRPTGPMLYRGPCIMA
jgi:anti-sigma-K factor RskA